ncbi:MAG: Sapep family Mn(2+)-dependent dipeptidase, partial [Sedimentibacter sp.]
MINEICGYIDDKKENILKDCSNIIKIPSISKNINDVKKCLDFALNLGKEYGFKVYKTKNSDVGVIEYGEGDETVGILVHVDVVDYGDINKWEKDPCSGFVDDENVWGRGAVDDKGPLIASLYAMRALKESGVDVNKKIQLIIGTQEEVEWSDMNNYIKEFKLPDYGFTPDGSFPIENREKGYADVELFFDRENFTNESVRIVEISSGDSVNTIPSKAEIIFEIINNFKQVLNEIEKISADKLEFVNDNTVKLTFYGISGHSSLPEKVDNVIYKMFKSICKFSYLPLDFKNMHDFIMKYVVDDFYGKRLGFYEQDPYYKGEYMGYTTITPTIVHSDVNKYVINLNMRTRFGTTKDSIIKTFSSTKKYKFNFTVSNYLDPLYIERDRKFLNEMASAYELISGYKNDFIIASGTSYAKAMPNIVSWGPI